MPTTEIITTPSERTLRIIALAKEALDGANFVRKRIYASREAALQCGTLLQEEKAAAYKAHGHGSWLPYYEVTFAKLLPLRTALHWMKCARMENLATLEQPSESNNLRSAVLALELFPPKQHTDAGNTRVRLAKGEIRLPKHSTHLGIVNRFSAWKTWFTAETKGEPEREQVEQLLKDLEPIEQYISWLRQMLET